MSQQQQQIIPIILLLGSRSHNNTGVILLVRLAFLLPSDKFQLSFNKKLAVGIPTGRIAGSQKSCRRQL